MNGAVLEKNSTVVNDAWPIDFQIPLGLPADFSFAFPVGLSRFLKRSLDVAVAFTALMALSPLLFFIAALINLESDGSVIFGSVRIGRDGKRFRMLKFRTMCAGAEKVLEQNPGLATRFEAGFKLKDDPRVTLLGRFLRRTCLDELPQLFNVLLGDMSLVGPRPILPKEIQRVSPLRLRVKPGLTGLWQISGKSALPYEKKCELDNFYATCGNFAMDLKILALTIPAIIKGEGFF